MLQYNIQKSAKAGSMKGTWLKVQKIILLITDIIGNLVYLKLIIIRTKI